jgi:hypothetical protein
MAEWIARIYQVGKVDRVVVEVLTQFEVEGLEGVEDRTANAILSRLRMAYPSRPKPRRSLLSRPYLPRAFLPPWSGRSASPRFLSLDRPIPTVTLES